MYLKNKQLQTLASSLKFWALWKQNSQFAAKCHTAIKYKFIRADAD